MYKMIRCGIGFDPVIMVSPPDAGPDTPDAKFFRCASWQIGDHHPDIFNEISRELALSYFGGIADGIGFETPPMETFPTLDAVLQFVIKKRNEWGRKRLEELGIDPDKDVVHRRPNRKEAEMPTAPTRIIFDLGDKIRISPPIWPEHKLNIQPGDLSGFAPYGDGVYGYQDREGSNPFTNAPPHEACGGVIYFGNGVARADFEALMRILEVQSRFVVKPSKDFAVFTAESKQPGKDGFLAQMRVISKFGLRFMFGALTDAEYEKLPEQELTVVEALWSFIEQERKRWGTSFLQDGESGLQGLFGGDGDFAREELAFGFMVENDYHNIYRIWSRAWLVTK